MEFFHRLTLAVILENRDEFNNLMQQMKEEYDKIRLEWINFLERFSANQLDIKFSKTETEYVHYIIENILDTNISFSSKYGFLTAIFTEEKIKKRFLELIYMKSFLENTKFEEHNNFKINYPCRIYIGNKLMVNFYDKDNLIKNDTIINRVFVFQNIFNILIKIKIENIKLN